MNSPNGPGIKKTDLTVGSSEIRTDAHGSAQQRLTELLYANAPQNSIPQSFEDIDWRIRALNCLRWAHTHYRLYEYDQAKLSLIEFEIADLHVHDTQPHKGEGSL